MSSYIAITIGPIYETLRLTSKPAGLWAASFLFSSITKRLCEGLLVGEDNSIAKGKNGILSPYYDDSIDLSDGIGRFYDHIIFIPREEPEAALKKLSSLFNEVSDEFARYICPDDKTLFRQYMQFHAIHFSAEKPLIESGKLLDAIELEQTFPAIVTGMDLGKLFEDNSWLKTFAKNLGVNEKWILRDRNYGDKLRDMADIIVYHTEVKRAKAEERKPRKLYSYYAIVQSDGDNMREYIKKRNNDEDFSKDCLDFCEEAAKMIHGYGGVTIFAGGDDLLFIAPLVGEIEGKEANLLVLLERLRIGFTDKFVDTTLSFGVAVRYYKYPLYEAFDEVRSLLFTNAKGNKNALALSLKKHSGQSDGFILEQLDSNLITEDLIKLIDSHMEEEWLKSVTTHIHEQERSFSFALEQNDTEVLKNIFDNTFDHPSQSDKPDVENARLLLEECNKSAKDKDGKVVCDNEGDKLPQVQVIDSTPTYPGQSSLAVQVLDALLWFVKFYSEVGLEEGDGND